MFNEHEKNIQNLNLLILSLEINYSHDESQKRGEKLNFLVEIGKSVALRHGLAREK